MRRIVPLLLVVALAAAACGDSGGGDTSPPADSPPGTDAPPGTDPPGTTVLGGSEGSAADLAITDVVFGADGGVTITNLGAGTVTLDGLWLCHRPQYVALAGSLAPGESTVVPAADVPPLDASGGDLGLYTASDFGSPDAIVDYVAWGGGGGRLSVAVTAGIWPDGDAVAGGGASISAPNGGAAAGDWSSS